jgi:hypothetical protein
LHHEFNSGIKGLKYKFMLELQLCLKTQLLLTWRLSFIATLSEEFYVIESLHMPGCAMTPVVLRTVTTNVLSYKHADEPWHYNFFLLVVTVC